MSFFSKLGDMFGAQQQPSQTTYTTTGSTTTITTETEKQRLGAIVQPVVITEKQVKQTVVPVSTRTIDIDTRDITTEKKFESPSLAEEKVHHLQTEYLQPEIVRDIYKTEVRQIQQPVHEERTLPLQEHSQVLPEKVVEINNNKGWSAAAVPAAHSYSDTTVERIERAPVVHERVHTRIIEDVQPIVYRDVYQPHHTLIRQPVHEIIREAPVVVSSTASMVETKNAGMLEKTGLKALFSRPASTVSEMAHRADSEIRGEFTHLAAAMTPAKSVDRVERVERVTAVAPAILEVSSTATTRSQVDDYAPEVSLGGLPSRKPVQFMQGM